MKNISKLLLALTAACLTVSSTVSADPLLNYNTLEAGYRFTDPDPGAEFNGGYGYASVSIIPNTFFDVGYSSDTSDDVDIRTLRYGGGAYIELGRNVHLVGNVGGLRHEVELNEGGVFLDPHEFGSGTFNRIYAGPELRARLHQNFEVDFGYTWEGGGDEKNVDHYKLGTLFALSDFAALKAGWEFLGEDASQFSGGVRFTF